MSTPRILSLTERRGGCEIWTRGKNSEGCGVIRIGASLQYAHRIAWKQAGKPALRGYHVLRSTCGNPACCSPDHRERITRRQLGREAAARAT